MLTSKKIIRFWTPLAATWLMMSVEGPFVTAVIARLADETHNLAAFGIAYAFALLSESPVIMLMAAATSLVRGRTSYRRLRNFTLMLVVLVTFSLALVLFSPLFDFLIYDVLNLSSLIHDLTHLTLVFMLVWPGAIAWRRFLQGLLIVNNETRIVSYGTAIRLVLMALTALFFYFHPLLPGAAVGGLALGVGVTAEMLVTWYLSRHTIRKVLRQEEAEPGKILSMKGVVNFYYPLALATFLGLGIQPMLTFFLGQSRMALESLAILPVVNAFIFIFRSIGLSFQEVAITFLHHSREQFSFLHRFVLKVSAVVTAIVLLIVLTPLLHLWYQDISGLSPLLTDLSLGPTLIMSLLPALSLYISWQRAIEVQARQTRHLTISTAIEVLVIGLVMLFLIQADTIGIYAVAVAMTCGRLAANAYLFITNRYSLKLLFR